MFSRISIDSPSGSSGTRCYTPLESRRPRQDEDTEETGIFGEDMGIDTAAYRRLMGHFATGVAVVTTEVDGNLHGMTANAVASVSLDPVLLLVCIDKRSQAYRQFVVARRFAVNILSEAQEAVSRLFAERAGPEKGRLRGVPFHFGAAGTPLIEGCLAHLECEVEERLPGGDHDIFIGRVLGGDVAGDGSPLLYDRGAYRRLVP
jgi:flavin reductase (DIM6/NTAB) family NADH-FMN oxidoreductase RutF